MAIPKCAFVNINQTGVSVSPPHVINTTLPQPVDPQKSLPMVQKLTVTQGTLTGVTAELTSSTNLQTKVYFGSFQTIAYTLEVAVSEFPDGALGSASGRLT